jgi:hypothetical protein
VRRAGSGRLPDGALVTWTVADGSKGRRWREAVSDASGIRHSLLFETAPDRRFSHLELSTPAGLLTLHPEGDGTLHGNVVDPSGVRHVVGLPWEPDGLVDLEGSVVTAAACAWLLERERSGGAGAPAVVLGIGHALSLDTHRVAVARRWDGSWGIAGASRFAADLDGLPVLADGLTWPLELAEEGSEPRARR